jgi:hypothetical protein
MTTRHYETSSDTPIYRKSTDLALEREIDASLDTVPSKRRSHALTKKIYQPDNGTPCDPPADIWYGPSDGSEPECERLWRVAALGACPATRKKGTARCMNTVAIGDRSSRYGAKAKEPWEEVRD